MARSCGARSSGWAFATAISKTYSKKCSWPLTGGRRASTPGAPSSPPGSSASACAPRAGEKLNDQALDAANERTPETDLEQRDLERRLKSVLDQTSLEKRATFVLFELEGLPCEQIAELMGVPLGTVHSRIHAARAHFKSALACDVRPDREEP
jgi:RNA polymerase sigma factor (sigma-70 family)